MVAFLLKRLFHGLVVFWIVATLTFFLLRFAPGGPFDRERRLPPEVIANIEAKYHLNEPFLTQYIRYLSGVARGDLGPSYKYVDRSVNDIIRETLPISALLGALALAFAVFIAFPLGTIAGYYRNSSLDRAAMFLATLGISVPHFILGAFLIWLLALQLGWFPAGRWDH